MQSRGSRRARGALNGGLIAVVLAVAGLLAPAGPAQARTVAAHSHAVAHDASCPWMNPALSARRRAQMLLGAMTEAQKIALTAQQLPLDGHYGAAGYLAGIPGLCMPDLVFNDAGEGVGDGQANTTAFPAPIAQASSWDTGLGYAFGQALGDEAHGKGIDVQLDPGIETDRVPA